MKIKILLFFLLIVFSLSPVFSQDVNQFVIGSDGNLTWVGYGVRSKGHVAKVMSELGIE